MAINPRVNSRFRLTDPILTRNGQETFGRMTKFEFLDRDNLPDDQIGQMTVDANTAGRPEKVAAAVYDGRVDLDWVIVFFNHVENPFQYPGNWPVIGQIVEYPIASIVLPEV